MQEALVSARYYQGLYNPNGFHIHPLNYARALARECERLGGQLFERSPACALVTGRRRFVASAHGGGEVRAKDIVIACGGYTDSLGAPAAAQLLADRHLCHADAAEPGADQQRHPDHGGDRRRPPRRGLLPAGGRRRAHPVGRQNHHAHHASRAGSRACCTRAWCSTYPQLTAVRVDIAWSGLMAYARHLMPQIGQLSDGTVVLHGIRRPRPQHHGHRRTAWWPKRSPGTAIATGCSHLRPALERWLRRPRCRPGHLLEHAGDGLHTRTPSLSNRTPFQ